MSRWGPLACAVPLSVSVCVLVCAASARANEPTVSVATVVNPAAALSSFEVDGLARAALAESSGFQFQDAENVWRRDVGSAQASYARLLEKLKRGRQAFLTLELASALPELEGAVAELPDAIAALDSPERAAEALMYLGASYVLSGDDLAAQRVFARYHVQFGDIAPDDSVFNPQILARFQAARQQIDQLPTATLGVEAPEGAAVFIDGRARAIGSADVSLRGGEHWVRVTLPFAAPFVARVMLRPGEKQRVVAVLSVPYEERFDLQTSASVHGLSAKLGVAMLGVLRIREQDDGGALRITLDAFDGESGRQVFEHEDGAGPDLASRSLAVRRLVAMLLDQTLARSAERAQEPQAAREQEQERKAPASPKDDASKKRLWFWAAAGGVAALAAGAAVFFVARSKDEPAATVPRDRGTIVLEF